MRAPREGEPGELPAGAAAVTEAAEAAVPVAAAGDGAHMDAPAHRSAHGMAGPPAPPAGAPHAHGGSNVTTVSSQAGNSRHNGGNTGSADVDMRAHDAMRGLGAALQAPLAAAQPQEQLAAVQLEEQLAAARLEGLTTRCVLEAKQRELDVLRNTITDAGYNVRVHAAAHCTRRCSSKLPAA
eukprot:363257-Chlamydomonas_euryale.AAC.8